MEIQYQFFKEDNLLVQKYIGDFSIEDHMTYINNLLKNPKCKCIKKVFSDFRKIKPDLTLEIIEKLTKFRIETIRKKYLNVFLVDNPESTVIAHLYQQKLLNYNYCRTTYEYCSTIDYAINLLKLSETKIKMGDILNNLKYKN